MAINTPKRDLSICDKIASMMAEKSRRGVKKYKESYIYDIIADEYGLAARTVENIWRSKQYKE
jgi:hypothetical protein